MIYLLYGSNFQAGRKKFNEIIGEYRKKNGDLNIHRFDAEEDGIEKIKGALDTNSLFSTKKLVTIQYLCDSAEKGTLFDIFKNLKDDPETLILLFERELGAKKLAELKPLCHKIQEFPSTSSGQANTIGQNINIFKLGDAFFTDKKEALRNLTGLLDSGHDEMNIFSYLVNHARTLATIKFYNDRQKPIPANHKIHPYVIKKASAMTRAFPPDYLPEFLQRFFEEDRKIKTGLSKPAESLLNILMQK
jgi:DNA polymerase III delta subunit